MKAAPAILLSLPAHLAFLFLIILETAAAADEAKIAEQHLLYGDRPAAGFHVSTWSMTREERPGGNTADGRYIWLNNDWMARPWAGFRVTGGKGFALTGEWIENGFARFLINATVNRYGHPAGDLTVQVRPETADAKYVRLPSRFIGRGRGRDEDEASWQEVLMPLSLWHELRPGQQVTGLNIQTVQQATLAFGFDEVGFVRFDRQPEWYEAMRNADTAQPWVRWPEFEELPDLLRADRHPPAVRDGAFVRPDGSRVFVINPYAGEDQGLDLGEKSPWGLYDPAAHGWIYREPLALRTLSRLGFNSFSVTPVPSPWWRSLGCAEKDYRRPEMLSATRERVGAPFFVDMVCWPWTMGQPAGSKALPEEALTVGRDHWVPYRIIGKGRETWLDMWRFNARRYAENDVPVLMFELFNEPAYVGISSDHQAEFAEWLRKRYGALEDLNRVWRGDFSDWSTAARFTGETGEVEGRALDYDEYLAGRFAELVRDGANTAREALPEALIGVQTMSGYVRRPREAVWKHRLVEHETFVLTPTGGGAWSPGGGDEEAPARALDAGIAGAPFENDLLFALAGDKMIFDNEFYSRGAEAREVHDQLWRHVIVGLDGLSTFSWSKRGWVWHKDRAQVVDEAEKFPYCMLNPAARSTASLRGIFDFAAAIQPVSHLILPKPWGPRPRIALIHSWANVRHRVLHPEIPDKTEIYHQSLRYSHWNMALLPADRALRERALSPFDVVIIAGVTHVEPELVPILDAYVREGGVLVVGERLFDRDVYGNPVAHDLPGVQLAEAGAADAPGSGAIAAIPGAEAVLPGEIRANRGVPTVTPEPGTDRLFTDSMETIVVTKKSLGKGSVYFQAADLAGYPLAKVLWGILTDAARSVEGGFEAWRLAEIRGPSGELATNILLSRRSHPEIGRHAILLANQDRRGKTFQFRFDPGPGAWSIREQIGGRDLGRFDRTALNEKGVSLTLDAGQPAVLMVEKVP